MFRRYSTAQLVVGIAGLCIVFFCIIIGFEGCSTNKSSEVPLAPPQPYTRIGHPDSNTVALQIAVRKFVPVSGKGPAVWLVGTSHVGETNYYGELQKLLNGSTVVLYEGVNADVHKRRVRGGNDESALTNPLKHQESKPDKPEEESIQQTLAHSLGLVFQLDAIDYDRSNFFNSDLSIQEIQQLMQPQGTNATAATQGEGQGNSSFTYLMQVMDGSSFMGTVMKMGMQFIGSSPKLQAIAKLTLIETLGGLKGELTEVKGLPEDMKQLVKVLIESRNKVVVEDLQAEARKVKSSGSLAVFYGTGHMQDMERRFTQAMKYKPSEEIWYTAFAVDTKKAKLSDAEIEMVRNMVKWQMDQMQKGE